MNTQKTLDGRDTQTWIQWKGKTAILHSIHGKKVLGRLMNDNKRFMVYRKENHKLRKINGWTLSMFLVEELKKREIQEVVIATERRYLKIPLSKFLEKGIEVCFAPYERQMGVSEEHFTILGRVTDI